VRSGDPRRTKSRRETTPSVLKNAIVTKLDQRIVAKGEIEFPCVPALLDTFMARLVALFTAMGKPFSDEELENLRRAVQTVTEQGYRFSSQARTVVAYETQAPPEPGIAYRVFPRAPSTNDVYAGWVSSRAGSLFGARADAKVIAVAESLGAPESVRVLDVGAGTGRNAIPLARRGHPVTAIEPAGALAAELRKAARDAEVRVDVVEADALSGDVALEPGRFHLAVLAEVVPHLRSATELRTLLAKVGAAVAPGGRLLFNAFVALEGYKPDAIARQVGEVAWSGMFTRAELAFVTEELPFERVSDEGAFDYEKAHTPPEAWPPTPWFPDWALGRNVFALPPGRAPVELRWLDHRRRE